MFNRAEVPAGRDPVSFEDSVTVEFVGDTHESIEKARKIRSKTEMVSLFSFNFNFQFHF